MVLTWTSEHYPEQLLSTVRISRGQRSFRDHRQFGCCQHVLEDENLGVWMLLHASWTQWQKTVPRSLDLLVYMEPMCFLSVSQRGLVQQVLLRKLNTSQSWDFQKMKLSLTLYVHPQCSVFPSPTTLSWCEILSYLLTEFLREYKSAFPKHCHPRQPSKQLLGEETEMQKLRQSSSIFGFLEQHPSPENLFYLKRT